MSKKQLPVAPEGRPCASISCELKPKALDSWHSGIKAASTDNTIAILDVIGEDFWGEGVTVKRISAALRAVGGGDVVVNINSPGGDMFEGLAIYNVLRAYEGKVTVKVLGIAASAASIIAMAGDEIQMGRGAFLMIHNCWALGIGNRHDFAKLARDLEPFDNAMGDIYRARSGLDENTIVQMMDNETYIGASEAIDRGLADSLMSAEVIESGDESHQAALRKIDALLAKTNTPRAERRKLIKSLTGSPPGATPEINPETLAALQQAVNAFAPAHP
ncbi:head maturation protease, ClpP-related [Xenorhabdus bovienii]|uniref:head maturation protease, ClpP-related n=1 Tax=Xenorhabdus bovienii TaxID=40576 RepID=UPI003DA4511B